MNARSDKLIHPHSQQLAAFAEQLQSRIADERLLDDIHKAIQDMLWDNEGIEADIRRTLHEQHESGNVRDETLELVQQMLDRMVSSEDKAAANDDTPGDAPPPSPPAAKSTYPFVDTAVLEAFSLAAESEGDSLQVGSVLRDRYLLQEQVASGSMGVVYKALDRHEAETGGLNSAVAIKVLSPEISRDDNAMRALQQEAAKGRCLSHPNIVRFIDLDHEDDIYFIVMEWLDGRSLADILDDSASKKFDKATALQSIKQVAKGLDYAHLRGVIHADVKPGNIMVLLNGTVKLLDFGLARVRQKQFGGQADFDPGMSDAGAPAYSSMQVLSGEEPAAADDVFSLGCLMYRLIAGYRVFGPRNAVEAADAGMEPQRPQSLNDAEWQALRKALSFSHASRFASPKEFLRALSRGVVSDDTRPVAQLEGSDADKRRLWPSLLTVAVMGGGLYGLYNAGMLDQVMSLAEPDATTIDSQTVAAEQASAEPEVVEEPAADDSDILPTDEAPAVVDSPELLPEDDVIPQEQLVDFSNLPPATVEVPLAFSGTVRTEFELTLRENNAPAIVDLLRESGISDALVVKLEEVGYSGNRSPWEAGQYQISDESTVRFAPGQDRARVTVSMTPDPLREPDRQVSLLVRDAGDSESELALINLSLEDDDQRRFESGLGPNTVAFAVGQVSVRERDPAVQIDLVRFNPDRTTLTVEYILREVTATEGEDYFSPGLSSIQFGPGQRSARILIPLVQDSNREPDEAFVLEITNQQAEATDANIFRRIAVMIRDDDSNPE